MDNQDMTTFDDTENERVFTPSSPQDEATEADLDALLEELKDEDEEQ